MARLDMLNMLYAQKKSIKDFNYDAITAPPMRSLLSDYDINMIEQICRDPRLDSSIKDRKEYIRQILEPRGFVRFASGTNRVVYKFLEDQSFLLKVAVSKAGLNDSKDEWNNQFKIKPFCAKCFEVSNQGAIGSFERVETINTLEQYIAVAEDHFDLLEKVIGRNGIIMADVGNKFWMNLGIRTGFGLVFVDYPLAYEVDVEKLFCNVKKYGSTIPCGGQIDYDPGRNFLYCTKCGKQYLASTLQKNIKNGTINFIKAKENNNMKMKVMYGDNVIESNNITSADSYLEATRKSKKKKEEIKTGGMKMKVIFDNKEVEKEEIAVNDIKDSSQDVSYTEPEKEENMELENIRDEEGYCAETEVEELVEDNTSIENMEVKVKDNIYEANVKIDGAFPESRESKYPAKKKKNKMNNY